jgi:anthraniloyl-CoA monooxygenase
MKLVTVGGGPAGLYLAILIKKADPSHDVTVLERNRADDTFGFGVVFSDATLGHFADADGETYRDMTASFAHWDSIDIHYQGQVLTSTGHGFAGLSRQALLDILRRRGEALGVHFQFQTEVGDLGLFADADLIVAADGVNSAVRTRYARHFGPSLDWRPNRFVWLGTTFPYRAFTFLFKENEHGLWRVHAYRYQEGASTFILEATEATWRRAGLDRATEDDTVAYAERLFAQELAGHRILNNRSLWRSFPTVRNARWHWQNLVLVGDAAHTAHFSIGSGTKLAMEDAIALSRALRWHRDVQTALQAYEAERRPEVESLQRAAEVSLRWFEETERYDGRLEPIQFAFSLLTRSLRVTHENFKQRDPKLVETVNRWFAEQASLQSGQQIPLPTPPPMFTPFRLRSLVLANRIVVSPMCQYSAEDGTPGEWHLVHLGSRAVGGAGLVMAEMTDVSRDGRISPGCTGMYKPEHVVAWRRIVDFVHAYTAAKIGLQLGHAGRKGSTRRPWEGDDDEPLISGNWPLIAASPIAYRSGSQVPKAMDRADMDRVREDFARATAMAEEAGFDLIELHFAHGYLLASFISPLTNARTDDCGGSLANRMRYPLEIFDAVRCVWPAEKPISVRISASDWAGGGTTGEEAVQTAAMLKAHGCDIIDVSAGQTVPYAQPAYGRLYQTPFSERIRLEAGIPTMTVGNLASYADVNSILAAGRADLCVLARGHLYDPYWTRHAAYEQDYDLPWPEPYRPVRSFTPRPG